MYIRAMNKSEKVIPPEKLDRITKLLFNKSRLSGGELARKLNYDANALWMDVHNRGLSVTRAKRIAKLCERWAEELNETAYRLEVLCAKAKQTRKEYLRSKRDVQANRRPKLGTRRIKARRLKS